MPLSAAQRATYRRYADAALPRHTSYPTVPHWRADWSGADQTLALQGVRPGPLGLYVHVPFCRKLCAYCGCNREIVADGARAAADPADGLIAGLAEELRRVRAAVGTRLLSSLHLGGGTPTFLTPAQLARLFAAVSDHFVLGRDAEVASEIDPRVTTKAHLATLRGLGFNRLSLGVQDFDPKVQEAIDRVQSFEQVAGVVDEARAKGFTSLSFDLIYGLPWQTPASLRETLRQVVELAPDRIALFRLALLPETLKWQRRFRAADLPSGDASLALMLLAVEQLTAAGYLWIGLDHFAKPHDALARAAAAGDLARSFQGMVSGRDTTTLAVGPSAITDGGDFYGQNARDFAGWRRLVRDDLPVVKGIRLGADDLVRRDALREIYAFGALDFGRFARRHGAEFHAYFADALPALAAMEAEGLLNLGPEALRLSLLGRLLTRVVAAAFDASLPPDAWKSGIGKGRASAAG